MSKKGAPKRASHALAPADALQVNTTRALCRPSTNELFVDPVATADGHVYEREFIQVCLGWHDTCPATGYRLARKDVVATPFL